MTTKEHSQEPESYEPLRHCGSRQVGKLYLVGNGIFYTCPSLPLVFKPCQSCEYEPPQYRDYQWIRKAYVKHIREPTEQACDQRCPICYPGTNSLDRYGLMWVGKKYYTPEFFLAEDKEMGICKAIKQIPKGLVLGETWVLLAHPEGFINRDEPYYKGRYEKWIIRGIDEGEPEPKPPTYPAVFSAFIPHKVELLIWESQITDEWINELEDVGITPVIIPDEYTAHRTRHRVVKTRKNIAKRADV